LRELAWNPVVEKELTRKRKGMMNVGRGKVLECYIFYLEKEGAA